MTKNILLVISKFPPEYSGPGVRIPKLYQWMAKNDHNYNFRVICNGIEQRKNEIYLHKGYSVQRITAGFFYDIFSVLPSRLSHALVYQVEFLKTLVSLYLSGRYKNIELVHVAGHSGGTAAALVWAKNLGIPVVMELVTEHARHIQRSFLLGKISVPEKSYVVALTDKTKQTCIKMGLEENKIWSRPNPIDDKKFKIEKEKKQDLRQSLTPFSESNIVICSVAKIMPQKNQILILKSLPYLPDNFVTVVAGPLIKEGPLYERDRKYFQNMQDIIAQNNLKNRVHFVTDFVEAEQYMKLSDIYTMPAWNEGFGTPMLEALGCGLPVIANKDEAAFQEWVRAGENGYLCDIQKPEEWAQAIEKVSEFDEEQRRKISANIHEKAGQEAIYAHYEGLFEDLLK
jgi:glycosyltransferase involved in cell wall biosynthesis